MSNADLIAEARGQVKGVMKDDGYGYIVPARDIASVNALLGRLADALEAKEREHPSNCNCGYGGFHEPENKNCEANQ
jgi:hypothetical protein